MPGDEVTAGGRGHQSILDEMMELIFLLVSIGNGIDNGDKLMNSEDILDISYPHLHLDATDGQPGEDEDCGGRGLTTY